MEVVYVLRLEHGMFYVGKTENLERRLEEHRRGSGARWTQLHRPLALVETRQLSPGTDFLEDNVVLEYMQKHGVDYVRGGSWSKEMLSESDRFSIVKQLRHARNACLRCGREGHMAKFCYARTPGDGEAMFSEQAAAESAEPAAKKKKSTAEPVAKKKKAEPAERKGRCYRCGREGHWEEDCYARTTIDGEPLSEEEEFVLAPQASAILMAAAEPAPKKKKKSTAEPAAKKKKKSTAEPAAKKKKKSTAEPVAKKKKAEPAERKGRCYRCGREGHWEEDCYARTTVDGRPLSDSGCVVF